MKTINDIITDKEIRETLYKLMLLNEQEWLIYKDTILINDYNYPENSGLYATGQKRLVKYKNHN